ncbi:unnamed protein product [Meloidogyne enterolobii]|uniref:Uncharacterized protein n=1 Tax=Meloidogyne enterolobii TaxID=390850 RepID=A0ACB1AXY4_MELEN
MDHEMSCFEISIFKSHRERYTTELSNIRKKWAIRNKIPKNSRDEPTEPISVFLSGNYQYGAECTGTCLGTKCQSNKSNTSIQGRINKNYDGTNKEARRGNRAERGRNRKIQGTRSKIDWGTRNIQDSRRARLRREERKRK